MSPEPSKWARMIAADPDHSHRYIERFKIMEAAGHDLYGEARTVDAMAPAGPASWTRAADRAGTRAGSISAATGWSGWTSIPS